MPFSVTGPERLASAPNSRDHQRLVGIVRVQPVQVAAELRAVGDRAARAVVPAEVVVDAEHVQLEVDALLLDGREAGGGQPDQARGVEVLELCAPPCGCTAAGRCRAATRSRCRCSRPRPRVVGVALDLGAQHAQRLVAHLGDREQAARHAEHRDLRPHQDAVAVGELQRVRVQGVMRT